MAATPPRAVLLIGVHREELAFGDAVAQGLDPGLVRVLRIPEGISGARPTQEGVFYYAANHQELYLQILSLVRGRYDLVIDLHCGINEPARCADLFSTDAELLGCIRTAIGQAWDDPAASVRTIFLGARASEGAVGAPGMPRAHTVIPEAFWRNPAFRYLGIECFLPAAGPGEAADWALARRLIDAALGCRQDQAVLQT